MSEHPGLHGAYALMPEMKSLSEAFSSFAEYDEPLPTPSTDMERYYSLSNNKTGFDEKTPHAIPDPTQSCGVSAASGAQDQKAERLFIS